LQVRLLFRQYKTLLPTRAFSTCPISILDNLREFRATWPNKNESARVKLGNLRAFFGFCHKSKWIEENYATDLKAGKVVDSKVVPLEQAELDNILKACDKHAHKTRGLILRALVLVLRYTGLRIRDAVTLRRDAIRDSRLYLGAAKTGTDVFCPLPPAVVNALAAVPPRGKFYFWSGNRNQRVRLAITRSL
jgi:integrase/recombinase XerD